MIKIDYTVEFNVVGQRLRTETNQLHSFAEGVAESVKLKFHLPELWHGYTVFAHFRQEDRFFDEILRTIPDVANGDENCVYLPRGIVSGRCAVSLYGKNGNSIITTNCLMLYINANGITSEDFEMPLSAYEGIIMRFIQASGGNIAIANSEQDITDESKIYIYTGDETVSPIRKTGHWYYYNNSKWNDGGGFTSLMGDELKLVDRIPELSAVLASYYQGVEMFSLFGEKNNIDDDDPSGHGVNFTWNGNVCHVDGDMTGSFSAYTLLYDNPEQMPWWLLPGQKYQIRINKTNTDENGEKIKLCLHWYGAQNREYDYYAEDAVMTAPSATGLRISIICLYRDIGNNHVRGDVTVGMYPEAHFNGDVYSGDKKLALEEDSTMVINNPLSKTISVAKLYDDMYISNADGIAYDVSPVYTGEYGVSDYVLINGYSGLYAKMPRVKTASPSSGYAFYGKNKEYISSVPSVGNSGSFEYTMNPVRIDIPSGAYYVRFTMLNDSFSCYAVSQEDSAEETIHDYHTGIVTVNAVDYNRYISSSNGASVFLNTNGVSKVSDYISINGYSYLLAKLPCVTSSSPMSGYAFYAKDKTFLSGISSIGGIEEVSYTANSVKIRIPSGAYYVRFTMLDDSFSFTLWSQEDAAKSSVDGNSMKSIDTSALVWENGYYNEYGDYYNTETHPEYSMVHQAITSDAVDVPAGTRIGFSGAPSKDGVPYVVWVIELDENDTFVKRTFIFAPDTNNTFKNRTVVTEYPRIRFEYMHQSATGVRVYPVEGLLFAVTEETPAMVKLSGVDSMDFTAYALLRSKPYTSVGVQNTVLNARQFTDIRWTPIVDMPGLKYEDGAYKNVYYPAGMRQKGIPYSRQDANNRQVSMNVGFDTFATACLFPNSNLYTQNEYSASLKRATYYGVVCSKLVQAAWGLPEIFNSEEIENLPGLEKIKSGGEWNENEIQVGDGVLKPDTHCAICTDILYDMTGTVRAIEISEAVTPSCVRRVWSVHDFFEHYAGYGLYRYSGIDGVKYHKSAYIDLEDGLVGTTDLPVQIRRGSFVNVKKDALLRADIDTTWVKLHIVKDGTNTEDEIEDSVVTLPTGVVGHYDVYPEDESGNTGNASSYYVYDSSETYSKDGDTLTITPSSACDAVFVVLRSKYGEYHQVTYIDGDGPVDVDISDENMMYCNVGYQAEYGIFYSETHTI